jgi:RNA recognition motif-containing protein
MKSIYVGNLPFTATENEVRALFSPFGEVQSVKIVSDRETGRPRGFAFVDMADAGADDAIKSLEGHEMGGRALKINEARPQAARPRPARPPRA